MKDLDPLNSKRSTVRPYLRSFTELSLYKQAKQSTYYFSFPARLILFSGRYHDTAVPDVCTY
jgi:hypothetical protein